MTNTREQAEICVKANDAKFGISIITAIEILYYVFEIWKNCPIARNPQRVLSRRYNEGKYTGAIMRRAYNSVQNGAERQGEALSDDDHKKLVVAALDHWRTADTSVVTACLAQPCTVVAGPQEDFSDNIN